MNRIISYLKRDLSLTLGIILFVLVGCYIGYTQYMLKNLGAITIARVDKFESAEQGVNIYITIYFRGKQYKTMVDAYCFGCEGQYFFIKIIKSEPATTPHLYPDHPVPSCILEKPLPFDGWKEIPKETCH